MDHYSGQSYEHRRDWLEQKLTDTASVFAIKLCAYAVMSNHYRVVLHVRPDIAAEWSDLEVVCSGQVILAADLEEFQKNSSALFGVNPPLC